MYDINFGMSFEKAKLYKTAYTPLYEQYVEIIKARENQGLIIFDCLLDGEYHMFTSSELSDFCL